MKSKSTSSFNYKEFQILTSQESNFSNGVIYKSRANCKKITVICIVIFLLISLFVSLGAVAQSVYVKTYVRGVSMQPTLNNYSSTTLQDKVYLNKYKKGTNGQIVVVYAPIRTGVEYLIKRIIAVEGDTLKIEINDTTSKVYLNGNELNETYIKEQFFSKGIDENVLSSKGIEKNPDGSFTIPQGYIFLMGDNRNNSTDSRYQNVGLVQKSNIVGTVEYTVKVGEKDLSEWELLWAGFGAFFEHLGQSFLGLFGIKV